MLPVEIPHNVSNKITNLRLQTTSCQDEDSQCTKQTETSNRNLVESTKFNLLQCSSSNTFSTFGLSLYLQEKGDKKKVYVVSVHDVRVSMILSLLVIVPFSCRQRSFP